MKIYIHYFSGGHVRSEFTKGGANLFKIPKDARAPEIDFNGNREGFYGWLGYGGSIVQWHPELKIGFAFVPTLINGIEIGNERGAALQQIVKDCTTKLNE